MRPRKEYETDFMSLVKALWRHALIIILTSVVFASSFFVYTQFFVTPTYASTAKMYVNNTSNTSTNNGNITNAEIEAAKKLVDTYLAILETPDTMMRVEEKLKSKGSGYDKYDYSRLLNMISVGTVNETQIFYITVIAPSKEEAEVIVDTIAEVLQVRISEVLEGSKAQIVQRGILPKSKHTPNVMKNTVIGGAIGFVLSAFLIVLFTLLDNTIHDKSYPTEAYGVRTLAAIPDLKKDFSGLRAAKRKRKHHFLRRIFGFDVRDTDESVLLCDKLPFRAAEAYKMLRTSLLNVSESNKSCVIGVSSPTSSDGKSVLAVNLAYTLARSDKSVLLIDANMRNPSIANVLKLNNAKGLAEVLDGAAASIKVSGYHEKWHVLTSGVCNEASSELLGANTMGKLIAKLRDKYDVIIIDLPPVNEVSDALAASVWLDGMVLTVRQDRSTKRDLDVAMGYMTYSKAPLLGFAITGTKASGGKYGR